jgi:hypothetical protein
MMEKIKEERKKLKNNPTHYIAKYECTDVRKIKFYFAIGTKHTRGISVIFIL